MHPLVILIPLSAVIVGPRLWVTHVLKSHDAENEALPGNAAELARAWLDANHLERVKVEITDLGDHYDPKARAVRLSRDRFDRKSLTAITTAAHEVSHALQDADDYAPFVWRTHLAGLAQVLGKVGAVILLAVPAAALFSRRPIPPLLMGSTLLIMLGSGIALQLSALQSELDASFKRALPMLREGVIDEARQTDARQILIACSLTYVASSVLSVLNIWPWLGSGLRSRASLSRQVALTAQFQTSTGRSQSVRESRCTRHVQEGRSSTAEVFLRRVAKPLIRGILRLRQQVT